MTLVVGVETLAPGTGNPCVLLCSDSRGTHTSGMVFETGSKVLRTRTGWVVGYSGELRFQHAFFAALRKGGEEFQLPPVLEGIDAVALQDILTLDWMPHFREALARNGFAGKWDSDEWSKDDHGAVLLGVHGILFEFIFWTVRRVPVAAIGIARQYALGALDSMAKTGREFPKLWAASDLHEVIEMAAGQYSDVALPSICIWTGSPGSQTFGKSSLPEERREGTGRGDGKVWRSGAWRDPE